jgi:hypothetical protein
VCGPDRVVQMSFPSSGSLLSTLQRWRFLLVARSGYREVDVKFGAYEILHELKSGGMGSVLLGRRKGPGAFEQLVAIKTIRPEYAATEAVRAMFLDEAKIVGGINHPGIATIHDFGEEAGTLYMAMEYVAGLSFRSAMELPDGVPPAIAARAIAEACRGLHAAHEVRDPAGHLQGVVHRDVSPDNLLLGFDGHVKVIDFGIALVKNRQSPVTEFGTVKGKPPYMSPEQVKNEVLDRRSDVFSLAVVLHELLTGQLLFDGDSIYAVARQVEHMEIPPPSRVAGPLPVGLDAVVMAALERDPAKRTPSAAAFAEQLEQVIGGDESLEAWAERALADERDRHRAWLAEIVAGRDAPRPMGRATGSVTALGPLALVDPHARTPVRAPSPSVDEIVEPPRRRLALPIAILLLLALAAIGVVMLTRSPNAPSPDAAVADTAPDTAIVVVASPDAALVEPDAALPDAAVVEPDAAVDAGRVVARDAGIKRTPDAAIPDAAVEPVPVITGSGKLIVRHHPTSKTFLRVLVDNQPFGDTPILPARVIPAGPHTITLIEPIDNKVVYQTKITVADGASVTVVQPAP